MVLLRQLILVILAALLALAAHANDAKWSHAEVVLSSDDAIEDPELRELVESQPLIRKKYEDVPQPQLHFFREGDETSSEVVFMTYIPLSMVKNMLNEKNLFRKSMYDDL